MPDAPTVDVDPFAPAVRGLDEPDPTRPVLRAAGPLVRLAAPAGGWVWVVTNESLARQVFTDPRLTKDPASAPPSWDPRAAGLEPTAADQPSLTTLEGAPHEVLRRAHAPLLSAARMRDFTPRVTAIARELLATLPTDEPVDLMADLSSRYPLTVLLDLLGAPLDRVDDAIAACRGMHSADPAVVGASMAGFAALAGSALHGRPDGLAAELRDRVPSGSTETDLHYFLFTLLFAGQLTTDPALGVVVAQVLAEGKGGGSDLDALVADALRAYPPAPFTLWRFTTVAMELGGTQLPARAPVLVDVLGIDTDPHRGPGPALSFGAGPHYCTGARLAVLELRTLAAVLREDFPYARLAVPRAALRRIHRGGIAGERLDALPVLLGG